MPVKMKREYLRLLESAMWAAEEAVDAFNRVGRPYKAETCLMLTTTAWELLAKSVLVKNHLNITKDNAGNTISAEVAVSRLKGLRLLDDNQEDCIQQIVSLRNCAVHHVLPATPAEILHHLFFFSCKFFRMVVAKVYPQKVSRLQGHYLSLSFAELTTYADKVQKLVSKVIRNDSSRRLIWLLDRGVKFDGHQYISQTQFEEQYKNKKKVLPHLALNAYLKGSDMVRVVAVQAPRNYTADLNLRKGSSADSSLPVLIRRTELESDYPYLTAELAQKLAKTRNFVAATVKFLGLKGNDQFHQAVRVSHSGVVHRYSQAALDRISGYVSVNPQFNPYMALRKIAQGPQTRS